MYIGGSLKMETPATNALIRGGTPGEAFAELVGEGLLGISYDLIWIKPSRILEAKEYGNYYRMVEEAAPVAVKNAMQAWRLHTEGQTTMSGRPINDPATPGAKKLTEAEAIGKLLGFQPLSSTKSYSAYQADTRREEVRSDFLNDLTVRMMAAEAAGDTREMAAVRKDMAAWNEESRAAGLHSQGIKEEDMRRRMRARQRENRATPKSMQKLEERRAAW